MTPKPTVFLVAEEVGESPDEGYAKVVAELGRAMARHATVITHRTRDGGGTSRTRLGLRRMAAVANRRLRGELAQARPSTVVYMSRSSVTLSALVRSRLLKWMAGGSRVVMIALQPRSLRWPGRLASRLLWPDLLLVSTDSERRGVEGLGARADRMVTGVDLEKFRPVGLDEKASLRRKWGIPVDTSVVLHVGHLTDGRNLEALLPLAVLPGLTVVVVASSQRHSASGRLEQRLRASGVVLIQGFITDIDEVYRLADCYVFPTISTDYAIAMPLSILEAMASDLPVVAMRFGALPERFGDADGIRLVESPGELVDGVLQQLRERPSTRRLSAGYSWAAVAAQVVAS
jgi:glycosyltransferase involved in cell wall biosynthesis